MPIMAGSSINNNKSIDYKSVLREALGPEKENWEIQGFLERLNF
jgi:hypothetical protein